MFVFKVFEYESGKLAYYSADAQLRVARIFSDNMVL